MLSCQACMRHYLQTVIGRPVQQPLLRALPTIKPLRSTFARTYASSTTYEENGRQRSAPRQQSNNVAVRNQDSGLPDTRFEKNRQEWLKSRGVRPPSKVKRKPNLDTESSMKKHLQYLRDPMKLSDYIRTTLRHDDFETAEKVVQYASKTMQCVVSWNHLVDWQLSRGKIGGAIKTFNEMKKRAQTPDAHTYTIIFRGCAAQKGSSQAFEKVLTIYHSMSADNCPVKPNTIHVNAVLKMCAKAGNMDAMFAIADHLPDTGLRAPNNLTYTTILNGLRSKLLTVGRSDMSAVQQRQEAQNAILTARHIWTDIVKRWRKGDIWIDEELVCSMGRLMLLGNDRDADDVLSLVEQTMSIPRQIPLKVHLPPPTLASPNEPTTLSPDIEEKEAVLDTATAEVELDTPVTPPEPEDAPLIPFTETVNPVQAPKGTSPYPIPSRNTLSLLLGALLKAKAHSGAPTTYWNLLTSPPYSIIPDSENYSAYLRTLRITRSSSTAITILSQMPSEMMTPGTFRIAISTCLRDKNNPHAFSNAGKLLDYMQGALTTPDPKVLDAYLELAITAPVNMPSTNFYAENSKTPQSPTTRPTPEQVTLKNRAHGLVISRALHRLGPSIINLRATLSWGDKDKFSAGPLEGKIREEYTLSVIRLAQRMVSAYDVLMDKGMVERTDYVPLTQERAKIAALITRLRHSRETGSAVAGEKERWQRREGARVDYKSYGPGRAARAEQEN